MLCFVHSESVFITFESKVTQLCLTLCNPIDCVACCAPLSMGFSRQEYWSGLPFPSPGELPDSGTELRSPALQADTLPTELHGKPHSLSHVLLFATPWTIQPWNSPGHNTGVGSLSLPQRIFQTQGLNPGLLHCR